MQINLNPDKLVSSVKPDVIKMLSSLKPGQTVSARVISQEPDGNAVLDFPFGRITLNLDKQVSAGERVWFEAAAGERQAGGNKESSIVLKLLDQSPASRSSFASEGTDTGNTATASSSRSDFRNALAAGGETSRPGFFEVSAKDTLLSLFDKGENAGTAVLSRMPEILLKKGEYGQGATVTARVIGMKGRDKALLSIKGEEIESKVSVPLQEGRIVFLEKTRSGDSKEFRILQPDNVRSSENLAASAQSEGGTGAFQKIIDLLAKLQIKPIDISTLNKQGKHGTSESFKINVENLFKAIMDSVQADSSSNASKRILSLSESLAVSHEKSPSSTEPLKIFIKDLSSAFETAKISPREGTEKIKDLLRQVVSGSSDIPSDKFLTFASIRDSLKETLDFLLKTPVDTGRILPGSVASKIENLIENLKGSIEKLQSNTENMTGNIQEKRSESGLVHSGQPVNTESLKNLIKNFAAALGKMGPDEVRLPENIQSFLVAAISDSSEIPQEIKNAIKNLLDSAPVQLSDATITADSKSADGKPMSLEAKMEKLMATLQDIALKSETAQEDFLHNLIKGSGISWENRISEALGKPEELSRIATQQDDIKAILLDALSDSSLLSPDVGKTLEAALDSLENLQMLNRMSVYDGGVFVLPFPVFSDNRFTFGQIFFDFSERQDKENREKPFRVSVLLDMTALGKVRADLSFMKKAVSGTVIVDSESSRQIIAENLSELEKKLIAQGFESANFGVRFPRSHDELESSSIFSKMVDHSGGLSLTV